MGGNLQKDDNEIFILTYQLRRIVRGENMLVGIINGYYRSGTTIMQRVFKESNPGILTLCEPTQHEIVRHILNVGCRNVVPLHGWNAFQDYGLLPFDVLMEYLMSFGKVFLETRDNFGIITQKDAAFTLLNAFIKTGVPIAIKSNQLHLFLHPIQQKTGCWILHLDRAEERVVAGHTHPNILLNKGAFESLFLSGIGVTGFYVDLVFENLKKALGLQPKNVTNLLDKIVWNVGVIRKIVEAQAKMNDKIVILDFDQIVENPYAFRSELPFNVRDEALRHLSTERRKKIPKWLPELVEQSKEKIKKDLSFNPTDCLTKLW